MTSLERLATECVLGVASVESVDACLARHPGEPELVAILRGPRKEKIASVVRVAAERGFDPISAMGGKLALSIVRDETERVLSGSVVAGRLGELVKRVDAMFLDSVHYPAPVHDLWNAFDWSDETWTLQSQPELRPVLESFVSACSGATFTR